MNDDICAFKVKGKELKAEDFRGKLYLKAIFRGKSKKLISGETYTVGLLKNGKVSVPVKQNPILTKYDNGIATTLASWEVCT